MPNGVRSVANSPTTTENLELHTLVAFTHETDHDLAHHLLIDHLHPNLPLCRCESLGRICTVPLQPRKRLLDHTDYTPATRQHELSIDHTDHTDHTDREYISPERCGSWIILIVGIDYLSVIYPMCVRLAMVRRLLWRRSCVGLVLCKVGLHRVKQRQRLKYTR